VAELEELKLGVQLGALEVEQDTEEQLTVELQLKHLLCHHLFNLLVLEIQVEINQDHKLIHNVELVAVELLVQEEIFQALAEMQKILVLHQVLRLIQHLHLLVLQELFQEAAEAVKETLEDLHPEEAAELHLEEGLHQLILEAAEAAEDSHLYLVDQVDQELY
tara:strand:- start:34 stop:522 length:489 start_codon:yes stop_codon:yes gene_type:complete